MLDSGGIGTYLKNLLLSFQKTPFRFRLIVHPSALQRHPWLSSFDLILGSFPIYSISEQLQLPLRIPACDLFWSPHYNVPLLPIRAKKRIVTIHDVYHLAYYASLKPLEKIYAKTVINRAVKSSDHVITVSQFSKSELLKYTGISDSKISVIYQGIQQHDFSISVNVPEKFVLFVGNVKPHKNLKKLAQAMKKIEGYSLVVAGKTEGFLNGEDCSQFSSNIIFLGKVSDAELAFLYQKASIVALPSFYEGCGLAPLEAMQWGTPVIVSQAASLPEMCGDAACYVNPQDAEDILRGILKVLASDEYKNQLIAKGKERSQFFSCDKAASEHIQLFERFTTPQSHPFRGG